MPLRTLAYVDVSPGEAVRVILDTTDPQAYINGTGNSIAITETQIGTTGVFTAEIYATSDLGEPETNGNSNLSFGDEIVVFGNVTSGTEKPVTIVRVVDKSAPAVVALKTAVGDAVADDNPDSTLGRLLTVERNQTEVLMPRLRRALGLLGEHQLVDGFLYDDDGNITECRLRLFESAVAMTDNATIWNDRVNDSEPDVTLASGEVARYTVTASNLLPRNLRTTYQQKITLAEDAGGGADDATPRDEAFGDMSSGTGSVM